MTMAGRRCPFGNVAGCLAVQAISRRTAFLASLRPLSLPVQQLIRLRRAVVFAGPTAFLAALRPLSDPEQTFYFVIPAKAGIHTCNGHIVIGNGGARSVMQESCRVACKSNARRSNRATSLQDISRPAARTASHREYWRRSGRCCRTDHRAAILPPGHRQRG